MHNFTSSFISIVQTYLCVAILVSTAIGLLGLPRYYQERDKEEETRIKKMCETTRSMLWDIIIHFIGFLLLAAFLGKAWLLSGLAAKP